MMKTPPIIKINYLKNHKPGNPLKAHIRCTKKNKRLKNKNFNKFTPSKNPK